MDFFHTFDYAYDLLSQGNISAAVIVDNLTAADLQRLTSLDHEVGIAVLDGRVVLFTSGDNGDIRLPSAVSALISTATFIMHTHTEAEGPSALDIANAGSLNEYVINTRGQVFCYNHQGLQGSTGTAVVAVNALNQAVSSWQAQPGDEVQAHALLNQFIQGMDAQMQNPQAPTTVFRSDLTLTPQQEQAFTFAEAALKTNLGLTDTTTFTRATVSCYSGDCTDSANANYGYYSLTITVPTPSCSGTDCTDTYSYLVNILATTDTSKLLKPLLTKAGARELSWAGQRFLAQRLPLFI